MSMGDMLRAGQPGLVVVPVKGINYAAMRKRSRRLAKLGLLVLVSRSDTKFCYKTTAAGASELLRHELEKAFRNLSDDIQEG